jgi:hypothetical protein
MEGAVAIEGRWHCRTGTGRMPPSAHTTQHLNKHLAFPLSRSWALGISYLGIVCIWHSAYGVRLRAYSTRPYYTYGSRPPGCALWQQRPIISNATAACLPPCLGAACGLYTQVLAWCRGCAPHLVMLLWRPQW